MAKEFTFKQYQEEAYVMIPPHDSERDEMLNWLVGLSEETGEVMSVFKHAFWGKEGFNPIELAKEVGDVLWYLQAICSVANLDLGICAELNLRKLQHRHGGKDFSYKASQMRHEKEKAFEQTEQYKELIKYLRKDQT